MSVKRMTVQQRKEVFLALVNLQDQMPNVRKSYEMITEQFGISDQQLRQIENEGVENEWPPLCEAVSS